MRTKDFWFDLPEELIAQSPQPERSSSRLLCLDKDSGRCQHRVFKDLPYLLRRGDLLVLNDSKVLPARLLGRREGDVEDAAPVELLLLRRRDELWECLVRPGKKLREGAVCAFGDGRLKAEIVSVLPDGNRLARFVHDGVFLEVLEALGEMPLPPYIRQRLDDANRYQTVYAKHPGSAAAPTAGLHFDELLLYALRDAGVQTAFVTLHVGLGTFRPVQAEDTDDHVMHSEWFSLPAETAEAISRTRWQGGRVIAVGTTVCRTLESRALQGRLVRPGAGETDIFIRPGYTFRVIDGLVTNFHLPESTLLMLVSALAGREAVLAAYAEAVRRGYRFFSFGDAMLIV